MLQIVKCAAGLLSLALLNGCSKNLVVIAAPELCRDWQHQTVSKDDKMTDKTASQIEANNKSRPAWGCKYGTNEANSG